MKFLERIEFENEKPFISFLIIFNNWRRNNLNSNDQIETIEKT